MKIIASHSSALVSREVLDSMDVKVVKGELKIDKSYHKEYILPKDCILDLTFRILNVYGLYVGYSDVNLLQITL